MEPGARFDPDGHIPEPVHGHGQREDSSAATSSSNGVPSAVAAAGGAEASSPSPPPAAPVDRPQERARGQGTHGSTSASAGAGVVDRKGKGLRADPSPAPSPPRSSGSSSSTFTPSPDSASPFEAGASSSAAMDSKKVFDRLVRDQRARNEAFIQFAEEDEKKKAEKGQAKSSHAKKALWSTFKSYFRKIVDREGRNVYSEHVARQTLLITEIGTYYRVTEDMPIRLNLDAFSRFRPVRGDGECFYRSFIFSYLEQVLDRQDTREEHRLLDIIKRVSKQHKNLGWSSEFPRSYRAFKKLIKKVMGWKRQGRWSIRASTNSYREEKLLEFFSNYETTEDILAFLRLVVAIRICSRVDEYVQIIPGINENYSLKDWCFRHVTPPRKFTDHIMMAALCTALEVPTRLERLFGAGGAQDIYTGPGVVNVILLYTGNHYDILYPHAPPAESSRQQTS
ncbi:unnamed protein product [Alopecurus aequalis]